jgi:hypothetical protein
MGSRSRVLRVFDMYPSVCVSFNGTRRSVPEGLSQEISDFGGVSLFSIRSGARCCRI